MRTPELKKENRLEVYEKEALIHVNEIFRTARRICGNNEDAEELLQETFLQAWKMFERYEPGTNCRAWLHKILINKYAQFRRADFRQRKGLIEVDEFVIGNAVQEDISLVGSI